LSTIDCLQIQEIIGYMAHAKRQLDQIERRVIHGEIIPHEEKVFSIFEPHTEWISKGKAGVPVELGIRVCILQDQHQFILHHHVMEHETDDKVAVKMTKTGKDKFSNLQSVSFDKCFNSKENQ
jgi:IS5 family transposase